MTPVTLALHAMATRFELVLHGEDPVLLRAAGEEALAEIERLEARLSLFRPTSAISHLNAFAAERPVRVEPRLFDLLRHSQRLSVETGGAFDITVAPLMRCWGFMGGTGRMPAPEALAEARAKVGMHLVELDEAGFTVRFARPGVMLDLGAIGKGYALDCAVEILREAGVTSALLHGGTSTVFGLGRPPDGDAWPVAIQKPATSAEIAEAQRTGRDEPPATLAVVKLSDEALSVSAVWGKFFSDAGKTYGHVIDPRVGAPTEHAVLAAVAIPSATESDALSTALLTLGTEGHECIANLRSGMRTLVAAQHLGGCDLDVRTRGIDADLHG
jgi:thiamine biosynthesis lipoprotein